MDIRTDIVGSGDGAAGVRRATWDTPFGKAAALMAVGLLLAAGCGGDVTPPADVDYSGTYDVHFVVAESGCAPHARPTGPWNPGSVDLPPVGLEDDAVWDVEHSANQLTIASTSPAPFPVPEPDFRWSITVSLASNLTFTAGPELVVEGTIDTDTGPLDWKVERSLDGAVTVVGAVPRITMTIEGTETFTEIGSGALFTTCVVRFAESAVRTSQ